MQQVIQCVASVNFGPNAVTATLNDGCATTLLGNNQDGMVARPCRLFYSLVMHRLLRP